MMRDVTDTSGFLEGEHGWKAVLAGALSVLVVAVGALVVRTGDPATADTYLSAVRDAAVVLPGGSTVTATEGMRVPEGAVLRTGSVGGATLRTAGRDVYVGAESAVRVVDGVHQRLDQGQVMVDTRNGPQLRLLTLAGAVRVADSSLARVEQGAKLRLAVFAGTSWLTATGRQAETTVHALYQAKAAYGAVGETPTPLALNDDAWERRLAPALVTADLDLRALGRGLAGAEGQLVLQAASARLRAVPATSVDRGEQALAVAVAQASTDRDQVQALNQVQAYRAAGGSWGVVAALVSARVSAVSALLDGVLATPTTGPGPTVQAGGTPDLSGVLGPPTTVPTTRSPQPAPGPSSTRPQPSPTRSTSSPTATPTTSPVDTLLSTVAGLLSPSPSPPAPATSPTPILQLGPIRIG
jgi:hypothetical protein